MLNKDYMVKKKWVGWALVAYPEGDEPTRSSLGQLLYAA